MRRNRTWISLALALAFSSAISRGQVLNNDPNCTPTSCTPSNTTQVCTGASLSLADAAVNPTNGCIGSQFSASVSQEVTVGQSIVTTICLDECGNVCTNGCPGPQTNTVVPGIVSNGWSVVVGGWSTNGQGTNAVFTPADCGQGTITFITVWIDGCSTNRHTASADKDFKVVAVVDASASEGTIVATNENSKTYVVCKGTNDVTVTATPCPGVSEEELPDCWATTGGTGTSNLSRTVSKGACGSTTVTFTAGTSSKSVMVKVLEVTSSTASEGTEIDDGDGNSDTKTFVVCKGTGDVTVTATACPGLTDAQLAGTCWSTSGGSGTNLLTRTVSKTTCGSTTVTFTAGTSTRSVTVKVVEVSSATESEGTEIDDGDGNPGTKTYVACKGSGNVTITATPCPSMTEAELAGACWTTTGGSGTAKLTRTVSKGTCGSTTVTFTAGTSTKSVTVKVVEVSSAAVSEGTEVDDGDDNPDTKTFAICKGTGNVSVTATPCPGLGEPQLAGTCWSASGGSGTALLTRTVSKATCGSTTVTFTAGTSTKSVTVLVVEIQVLTVAGATALGGNDYAAVKAASGSVIVQATVCPNVAAAASVVTWTGGDAVPGYPLQRSVSKSTSAKTTVTASYGSSSTNCNVWIVWATVSIQTSGSNPSPLSFPTNFPGNQLGVQYYYWTFNGNDVAISTNINSANLAIGKVCGVGTITPPGIHGVITNGWSFVQYKMPHLFANGAPYQGYYSDDWSIDPFSSKYVSLIPTDEDKIYFVDGPPVGKYASDSFEFYCNFYSYVTWNSEVCSSNSFWHYQGRWKVDGTPPISAVDLGTGIINLPTTAFFPPP